MYDIYEVVLMLILDMDIIKLLLNDIKGLVFYYYFIVLCLS